MSEQVGPYRLGALLGEGAAARVYAAEDARGREVAIKLLKRAADDDPVATARLDREADVLAELDHPGLVRVLDRGRDEADRPYLVLERIDGPSLAARLEADGPLGSSEAWRLVREVALALGAAHAAGVLHRDLTPANVLLDAKGRPRLSDFGLALRTTSADARLSQDGAGTGTPAFMAPEQWWGAALDVRTDVYGLGAVLYACLAGRPPWHGEASDILHQVATGEPPSLSEHAAVSPAVASFVRRALAREPRERPADVERFVLEGDLAFGHAVRRVPYDRLAAAAVLLAAPVALGFGGSHDPRSWIHEAGVGGFAVLLVALGVALLGPRLGAWRSLASVAPLVVGATAFITGMRVVMSNITDAPAEARFALFHYGLAEASSGWFLGAAATALLFGIDAAREGHEQRRWPSARGWIGLAACALTAALAAEAGALAVAMVAGALLVRRIPARRPDAALGSAYAVLALGLLAWMRLESESARLFESALGRAERAVSIARIHDAQEAGIAVTVVALASVLAAADWRALRAWPRARVRGAAAVSVGVVAIVLGPWLASRVDREALWAELRPRLSVWRELDPPRGEGTGPARLGATLQLGRRRVAVDGQDLAPIEALAGAGRTGPLLVAERLGPRITLAGDGPELVLAADGALPFAVVERALGAAYELGVRRVDLLLAPSASPPIDPDAPWEASVVLPRDLRALEVRLSDEPGAVRPAPEASFSHVAQALGEHPRLAVRPTP